MSDKGFIASTMRKCRRCGIPYPKLGESTPLCAEIASTIIKGGTIMPHHDFEEASTICIFCERPTKDLNAVCKRIWCRIKIKWEEIKYGRNKS